MTREQNRQQLINLFLHGDINIRDVINLTYDHADSHPQWIPVEKELPKRMNEKSRFSETVLVYNKDGYKETAYYDFEEKIWRWMPSVTHWMPLPQPPRKEE